MATIVTRAGKGSPLTHNEVDANFENLNSDKVETSSVSAFGATLIDDADAATARTTLGLGTAATTASTDYATSAQGANADTAYGWGNHASAGYLTDITGESIQALSDVATMSPTEGQALVYSSGSWTAADMSGGIAYTRKTANYTASANEGIIADTSGGSFTVTLPASPATGDTVMVVDGNDWSTTNLIVGRNGSTIEGDAADLTCDVGTVALQFTYDGTTWQIYTQAGSSGTNPSLFKTYEYTASASQSTFTGADDNGQTLSYTVGVIIVSLNGIELASSDYTASNGTSVVLTTAASAGDILQITTLATFSVANALPLSGGTLTGALSGTTLTLSGSLSLGAEVVETVYAISGTTPALDPANGTIQTWTLSGNSTPTDSLAAGESITLMIDDGTAYTITWPTMTWVNNAGAAPTLATSGYTVIALWKVGTTLYGALVGDGS